MVVVVGRRPSKAVSHAGKVNGEWREVEKGDGTVY